MLFPVANANKTAQQTLSQANNLISKNLNREYLCKTELGEVYFAQNPNTPIPTRAKKSYPATPFAK